MTPIELYQAEVARRLREGVPDGEEPSLLSQAVSKPAIIPSDVQVLMWKRFEAASRDQIERNLDMAQTLLGGRFTLAGLVNSEPRPPASPPAVSEFLFSLFGPKDRIDSMLGDLEELFHSDLEAGNARRARWRYRGRVWRSLGPLIFNKLKNWGFFAFVFEICRRKVGW
jgi:hypothetical protein